MLDRLEKDYSLRKCFLSCIEGLPKQNDDPKKLLVNQCAAVESSVQFFKFDVIKN